jgi:hypothetical protein
VYTDLLILKPKLTIFFPAGRKSDLSLLTGFAHSMISQALRGELLSIAPPARDAQGTEVKASVDCEAKAGDEKRSPTGACLFGLP